MPGIVIQQVDDISSMDDEFAGVDEGVSHRANPMMPTLSINETVKDSSAKRKKRSFSERSPEDGRNEQLHSVTMYNKIKAA